MLGRLPKSLNVNGKQYEIRPDFRNILDIFTALDDPELTDQEKGYIFLKRLYVNLQDIPKEDIEEAYKQAINFIQFDSHDRKKDESKTKLMDWERDENMIFPAINKAAGCEVRELPYLHWFTFMGYFQAIDSESLFGTVLSIRQKKAKGKKLEKWEKEFDRNNRELCALKPKEDLETPEDSIKAIYESLLRGD